MCINSKCEAPQKVMAMWDWLWTAEGKDFLSYGIEGVHFTKDANGEIQLNEDEISKETEDMLIDPLNKFQWFSDICSDVFYPSAIDAEKQEELFKYNKSIAVIPLVQGFTSENYVKYVGDMNTIRDEYFTKFITGELDIDENWQAFLDAFNQAGNELVTQDVNAFMDGK
jgi:putative aldouronate transport system substrate-binding protein